MHKSRSRIVIFILFYACALIAEFGGGYFTQMSVTTWYVGLDKSSLTPPGAAFGIMWTALYLLMSIAAERVHHRVGRLNCRALRWWAIQLLLGLDWCLVFFGQREIGQGLVIIVATWCAVAITLYFFRRVDKLAAWLMVPLLLWLSLASYLNFYIWLYN